MAKKISWNEIQQAADDETAVKNRAKEQAVEFANEIGAEIDADDEDDIASFVKDYEIDFLQDGTMAENRHLLQSVKPEFGHDYAVKEMLAKFLEEETEKNASDNKGKVFVANFSRNAFTVDDTNTILDYAEHLRDGSTMWMLGAKVGGERQLYYRDPINFKPGEWQKATVQEFFDFTGDFYAHNYDHESEFDVKNLPMMRELFPNSKDIEKLWTQHFTKNDMQLGDVRDISNHSAHYEIWSHLPSVDDDVGNPYITLEDAVEVAESYLENNDGLKDKNFGNLSKSTEEEKTTRKEFLSLLKNVNNALHSDEFHDNTFSIENATAENLDLLHAEVLKDCAALAREDFLSSFGEIIDGEFPNQEEADYRRQTLNDLRIDEKNLDSYLDDNANRLVENIYEKAKSIRGVDMFDFIEATVDTSDPTNEQEMEWNRALEELLDGYTDYKKFNEKWDVSLTPTTAMLYYLESEKELMHIAFDNALGDNNVEVPMEAENYKNFLDNIDFEKRFSHSNILRAETLQMNNARLQEKNIQQDNDIARFSAIFAGMEAPDLLGKSKNIEGLIENYRNTDGVKLPVVEAISTMLYDSPQIYENGSYDNFGALSMENYDNKYGRDGTDARNELCDMVAEKIVSDKSVKSFDQVKELLKNDSEKILKEKLEEKTMQNEERNLSKEEFDRLSNLLGNDTDSEGLDFKAKFDKKDQDVKQIVATLLHENREPEEAYALSPSYFDSESEEKDNDGYDMRWDLYENIAEKILSDKTITNMEQVENLISKESFRLEEEYNKEHNITQSQVEQEWPGLATWKELADIVGKDIYSFKDDVLENNEEISEKDWKTEALARILNDGVLDLRGFDTESTSKINELQYDRDFMKSDKGKIYSAINPEKWDVLTKVAENTVDEYSPEIVGTTAETLQQKYDEELSKDHVYLEAVEKGLVKIDKNMAEKILENNNPYMLQDGVKIAIVKSYAENEKPSWAKPERFIITPHDSFSDNYEDRVFANYLTDNRISSSEPKISTQQAEIISYYLMRNEYALYVDQKGNLNCVDFSEDFNLDDVGKVITNNELLKLTSDLIDKDIGFKDRAEEDSKEIQSLLKSYEKEQNVQKTQSPQQLYDNFIKNVEKEFKELKLLRAATINTIKTLSPEDKKIINEELKKRGAKSSEKLASIIRNSIKERHLKLQKEKTKKHERDDYSRER